MPEINVDGLLFVFPEGWEVDKFDELAFYRNQFSKQHNNIKAVDLLALECSKKTLWLIEVKDFSCHKRDKTEDLSDDINNDIPDFDSTDITAPKKKRGRKPKSAEELNE